MTTVTAKTLGGKRKTPKPRQTRQQKQQQQQHGGTNSSSTAALYRGETPMVKYNGGSALDPANYSAPSMGGNGLVGGLSVPAMKGGAAASTSSFPNPMTMFGGAGAMPIVGAESSVPMVGAGSSVPMVGAGSPMPMVAPSTGSLIKGGGILNNIAVPAVLLYANNTFGKKRGVPSKKNRRFRKKSSNKRTNRRRR